MFYRPSEAEDGRVHIFYLFNEEEMEWAILSFGRLYSRKILVLILKEADIHSGHDSVKKNLIARIEPRPSNPQPVATPSPRLEAYFSWIN